MRAILLLLMMIAAGCSSKSTNVLEFDVAVNAPGAASVVVDGKIMVAPAGGIYSRGFPSLAEAMKVSGTIETRATDGSARASSTYAFGGYCNGHTPLLRQIERFVEAADATTGAPVLSLDNIECELTDGTGVIVQP
jgi:hypothetical protein